MVHVIQSGSEQVAIHAKHVSGSYSHPPVSYQLAESLSAYSVNIQFGDISNDFGILNGKVARLFGTKNSLGVLASKRIHLSLSDTDKIYPFHAHW
ncbi:hypothetical protein EP331_12405 [bacterium]|nr:MAG: hypothetical protein EP331_12405 [bacterium]